MPRAARQKSESGVYHVLLRGIGQQNIFEDDEDRNRFIATLARYKKEHEFEIQAYCLMGNHVHLLMRDPSQQLDLIMKKIACSYAWYFNWKYERVGHLFQDRFKSEPVEDDRYYLTVLRYIHQNPHKAGVAATDNYKWSSYNEYVDKMQIADTDFALKLLGGREIFISFMREDENTQCLDTSERTRITDERAIEIIKKTAKVRNAQQVQKLDREKRDKVLAKLKDKGLSVRQIARLTGINRGIVLKT